MWKLITEAWRYRFVSENFVKTTLGNKYKRSALGYLWSVLLPLLRYLAMGLVFSYVLKNKDPNYFAMFFTGMMVFGFIQSTCLAGTNVFLDNANYLKKIYVPKLIFISNIILTELVNTLLVLAGLLVLGLATGIFHPSWQALAALPGFALIVVFLFGFIALLGTAEVWFNDVQYFVDILMQTLFFITPIMFPASFLPDFLYIYNPFYYLLEMVRFPLVQGQLPDLGMTGIACALTLVTFVAGLWVLNRKQNAIIFKL